MDLPIAALDHAARLAEQGPADAFPGAVDAAGAALVSALGGDPAGDPAVVLPLQAMNAPAEVRIAVARFLNLLGFAELRASQYRRSDQLADESLAVLLSGPLDREVAIWQLRTLLRKGQIRRTQGDFTAARKPEEEAVQIARDWNLRDWEARCLSNLALSYGREGLVSESTQLLSASLLIFRELGLQGDLVTVCNNVGAVLHNQGLYSAAYKLYVEVLEVAAETDEDVPPRLIGFTCANLADISIELGMPEQSWDYALQSLELIRSSLPEPRHQVMAWRAMRRLAKEAPQYADFSRTAHLGIHTVADLEDRLQRHDTGTGLLS